MASGGNAWRINLPALQGHAQQVLMKQSGTWEIAKDRYERGFKM